MYLDELARLGVADVLTLDTAFERYRCFAAEAWDAGAMTVAWPGLQAPENVDAAFRRGVRGGRGSRSRGDRNRCTRRDLTAALLRRGLRRDRVGACQESGCVDAGGEGPDLGEERIGPAWSPGLVPRLQEPGEHESVVRVRLAALGGHDAVARFEERDCFVVVSERRLAQAHRIRHRPKTAEVVVAPDVVVGREHVQRGPARSGVAAKPGDSGEYRRALNGIGSRDAGSNW